MNIEEKVTNYIKEEDLIRRGDRILLGLSGGADSVCLFYLLLALREEFGFALRAAHVHHGIRPEAEEDVSYVKELCAREKVPCRIFREDVPGYAKSRGFSEEEAGRLLRYEDFGKCLEDWKTEENAGRDCPNRFKTATAHHENDQAETVLFQLFRGCGLSGLRGILPERGNIIRPILCLSRKEIESYLMEKGISWCEDNTNLLTDYSRNKIRHRILPWAEEGISHGAAAHIGNTAKIVREAERFIERQVRAAYDKIASERKDVLVFDIERLRQEDIFLQKQLVLYGLEKLLPARKDIGAVHVEAVLKLMQKQGNGELNLPGGVRIGKSYGNLIFYRKSGERVKGRQGAPAAEVYAEYGGFLTGEACPEFKAERIDLCDRTAVKKHLGVSDISEIMECIPQKTYTKWFDYDKIETSFCVRHRESGDYLTINGEMNHKSLRRYMIEAKIPASDRDSVWLFADASHVMWIPGGRMSSRYKVTERTKSILLIRICGKSK